MKKLSILIMFVSLLGCATPAQYFNRQALALGFNSFFVKTAQFQHQIYTTKNIKEGGVLHVYLDGDGTPWIRNRWIADDPTARNPLILRLMSQDKQPSILLGRPCYYGLSQSFGCDNKYWTSHRYSKTVVQSMSHALNSWLEQYKFNEIVLIGYSGGGSLAILMADCIEKIKKVVTVAANLNVKTWSEYHGYATLNNSLDPSDVVRLNASIQQYHFAGKEDEVVPAFIIKQYADDQKNAQYFELAGKDHVCCWESEWKNILRFIE